MTNAGRHRANQNFARTGPIDFDFFDGERLFELAKNCCFHYLFDIPAAEHGALANFPYILGSPSRQILQDVSAGIATSGTDGTNE